MHARDDNMKTENHIILLTNLIFIIANCYPIEFKIFSFNMS